MNKLPAHLRFPALAPAVAEKPLEEKWEYQEREESSLYSSFELLAGMSLSDFRSSDLVVVVRCAVLGDEVVFAADGTDAALHGFDEKGRVIYRGEELRLMVLLGVHPEDLRGYHSLRKQVGAVQVESIGMPSPEEVKAENPKRKGRAA